MNCLSIEDYPDFPARGVMLDVSRDRVPPMETVYKLVDMLAGWYSVCMMNFCRILAVVCSTLADSLRRFDHLFEEYHSFATKGFPKG